MSTDARAAIKKALTQIRVDDITVSQLENGLHVVHVTIPTQDSAFSSEQVISLGKVFSTLMAARNLSDVRLELSNPMPRIHLKYKPED
jgi:hypothetical protein